MDIDVKNAYVNMVQFCGSEMQDEIVKDIYRFIKYISIDGANARFELFCKIYVHKSVVIENVKIKDDEFISQVIAKVDNPDGKAVTSIISFYTVLGKYYLFNKFDKKEIDKDKYISAIFSMNNNVKKDVGLHTKYSSIEKKDVTASETINGAIPEITQMKCTENIQEEAEESLEELLEKLNSLIGLEGVKEEVNQIISLIQLQKKGEELGEKVIPLSLHLVFYGNPGTGKTTVARLIAKIYRALGVLSKGQLVETDRGGLVGGYVGQTAIKTQEMIDKAMGGILFIDEAYTLTHDKGESDFGQEAVDTILKAMEDHRDDFIVIVAGYPKLMKEFIYSNPGLKSRFNQYIDFKDYTPDQLKEIFLLDCYNHNLILEDNCNEYLISYFTDLYANRSDDYANGRDVRNYFEKVIKMRANRLNPYLDKITLEEYRTITLIDLTMAAEVKESGW